MRIHLFSWLLLFQLLSVLGVSGQCLNDQRSLLLELKNNLEYDLPNSANLVNWNQSSDCCGWREVGCDDSGRVIGLELVNLLISGGIGNSTALLGLQYLEKLNLAYNSFNNSEIPKGFQNLTNLAYLNLSNAGFGGQVPIELASLRNLEVLDLSSQFQGVVPLKLENPNLETFVQNLTELKELYLDGVNISAHGLEWGRALSSSLPNLRNLSLRRCDISGPFDVSLSSLSLSVLQLDNNNLNTTVPEFFASFSSLSVLTLGFCNLQGFFPDKIFKVPTLQKLDLTNNLLLSGSISEFPHNGSLRSMVLSYTNFSGSLPDSIFYLRMLTTIDLSNCKFGGRIPSTIANLTELVYLDFSFNSLTGSIPPFHMSKKLTYIDLGRNSLTGSLSSKHFEGLSNLVYLNLGFNSLNGSIPPSLFGLPTLQKLILSNNKFSAPLSEVSNLNNSNLDTIDLSSNRLEGSIPESFFRLEQLNVLSLSYNLLNGTIKLESIQRLSNLTKLDLGYNNLSIDASTSDYSSLSQLSTLNLATCNLHDFPNLRNQSKLTFLDLSSNHIGGEIPSWIWEVGNGELRHLNLSSNLLWDFQKPFSISRSLSLLDLHSNQLQGEFPMPPPQAIYVDYSSNYFQTPIPLNIGNNISVALFFSVANNSLTGSIPASLCKATYLQVLDLSGNNLNGSIPPCLVETMENLGVLNLGRNKIMGEISDRFSINCGLKTLDLSSNTLQGKIPQSLANCKSLEVMNVGNNMIDDKFPCILRNLSSLRVLVLRSNRFHGDIRCHNGNGSNQSWPYLQIIDIAHNNFTGGLYPKCISSWRGMSLKNNAQLRDDHLRFKFLNLNNFYYQDAVRVTIKGLEMELVKILTVFTAIDLSHNNFTGKIPETVGGLSSLYILNLSQNSLTGNIPRSIGNLSQLGSLDLSENQLTGEIPRELATLTFLSFLNLSYNKLVGRIPIGSQFQTFSPKSFVGNVGLCGYPLNTSCDPNEPAEKPVVNEKKEFDWQFIFTGLGYGLGAAVILAPLAFCRTWREKCDRHLDEFLKLIFPRYGFSYVRYDSKVEAVEQIEEVTTDDDEDDDDDEEDKGDELSKGRYCVFCTKLDFQIKKAMHNPKCTCHYSPPTFSSSPTSSSSSSLLVIYQKVF